MKSPKKPFDNNFSKMLSGEKPANQSANKPANRTAKSKSDFGKKPFRKSNHNAQFSKPKPAANASARPTELTDYEKSLFLMEDDLDTNLVNKSPHHLENNAENDLENGSDNPEQSGENGDTPTYQRNYCFIDGDEDISDFGKVNYVTVTRQQHDQRVDNFLLARLKGLPRSHIYNMIRSDEIRVNKKRCKPFDKLVRGDIVRIAPVQLATREKPVISQNFVKGLLERVVYEDDGLIVLNKPSGMAVHGGSGETFGVIEAMREATDKKYLELVHRIDKDTSGLLMISKKRSTLKKLQDHLREKTIQKTYQCIVTGWVKDDSQTIDKPLLKFSLPATQEGKSGERRVKVDIKSPESKPSQTQVTVKQRFEINGKKVSLVECQPLTGRTHQIRVHMASIGHGILGDDKYNLQANPQGKPQATFKNNLAVKRLCLHAWRLQIPEYAVIEVAMPEDMARLIPIV